LCSDDEREIIATVCARCVVALLANLPAAALARGQVGTVVEISGKDAALVEFSGDDSRTYAIERCPTAWSCIMCPRLRLEGYDASLMAG
jgi:hypothetical protein